MMKGSIERPLRYTPEGMDFMINNGEEFFNRPLYGGATPFRVDAGDRPEYSLYLPGKGGNLRIGIRTDAGTKWLNNAKNIVARYRPGSMIHEITDPLLGSGKIQIDAISPREPESLILRVDATDLAGPVDLVFAFGGISGEKGSRDGDIGTERGPVSEFFRFDPENCRGNVVALEGNSFETKGKGGSVRGVFPAGTTLALGDATAWDKPSELFAKTSAAPASGLPMATGIIQIVSGRPIFLALQKVQLDQKKAEILDTYKEVAAERKIEDNAPKTIPNWVAEDLPEAFAKAEVERKAIAERVTVQTPDPYLNAAVSALNVAADAVWDDRQKAYLHGGVAWRARLLGWRVSYAGNALGWHDRTREHFDGYANQQNTNLVEKTIPAAEASANLARNEAALHSNGDMTRSHYDMNLVGVDSYFRHLLWTGDLEYARRTWPVIERHLAWERRLFRREFGKEKLPLYEAYCCIWASDGLGYAGGGATHSTAYNLFHNRMAAKVAKLIGQDPTIYEREAELIGRGIREQLWLKDFGWFGESKDLLGLQLVHPKAALWTFYHTVDSEVPTPIEAWQMSRYIDNEMPHIPVQGPNVPKGNYTLPTTTWMPYIWSLNNVVLAESAHTALSLWQSGRAEDAYPLLKGVLLDSMYLGICPGNVGMATWYDANRRESQRDFGDGIGTLARTVVEGVFGVIPDLLAGEVRLHPGFPKEWKNASMHHPDFDYAFTRNGETDQYSFQSRFSRPVALRLQVPAVRDDIEEVTDNGKAVKWRVLENSVGVPRIEIVTPTLVDHAIIIKWKGSVPAAFPMERVAVRGSVFKADAGAKITEVTDPQNALDQSNFSGSEFQGNVSGSNGHRTVFARVNQGALTWWQPIMLDVKDVNPPSPQVFTTDWSRPIGTNAKLETVALDSFFNDEVSGIFKNKYLSPRSPYCSLQVPIQGYGYWTAPAATFDVDDSGLRTVAGKNNDRIELPNGVPVATPSKADVKNIAFVSQWDNFPRELTVPLSGKASKAYLMMAGSTWGMQSRIDNGEIIVSYADGSTQRLPLENPTTWWPIDQDYLVDDFAYSREGGYPLRVNLATGKVRIIETTASHTGGKVVGGSGTILDLSLDSSKELKSLTVRALANDVVIGLMSATLQRPSAE